MPFSPPAKRPPAPRFGAFTLLEILIVIGIILLLTAISFPVFKSIQERGTQTTCATNLQQIYLAVRLYKDDEREYPASLAVLLPDSEKLADTANSAPDHGNNVEGTGYFRKTREELVCPDDDFQLVGADPAVQGPVRSSYGDTSNDPTQANDKSGETVTAQDGPITAADGTHNKTFYAAGNTRDYGRLAWNFWGYDNWGQGFRTEADAVAYFTNVTSKTPAIADLLLRSPDKVADTNNFVADASYTITAARPAPHPGTYYFNPRGKVHNKDSTTGTATGDLYEEPREANMFKYSLSNPQAPLGTIITHCAFHRLNTAKNAISPAASQLYAKTEVPALTAADFDAADADGTGARDIILRLDGTARSYDVSKWNDPNQPSTAHGSNWQNSDF